MLCCYYRYYYYYCMTLLLLQYNFLTLPSTLPSKTTNNLHCYPLFPPPPSNHLTITTTTSKPTVDNHNNNNNKYYLENDHLILPYCGVAHRWKRLLSVLLLFIAIICITYITCETQRQSSFFALKTTTTTTCIHLQFNFASLFAPVWLRTKHHPAINNNKILD